MGWFDDQIHQRKTNDDQMFRDSLQEAAQMVMGERQSRREDSQLLTADALQRVLRYYHMKYTEPPSKKQGVEEQLDHVVHPQGMMYRKVILEKGWHRDAVGAMLGFLAQDDTPVALIPSGFLGYRCYDPAKGDWFLVNSRTAVRLKDEAYCFYRPFPQKEIGIPDLIKYILISLRLSDFLLVLAVTLLGVLVGFLVPRLTELLYGPVRNSGNVSVLLAMGIFLLCVRISMLIINTGTELVSGCVQTRLQLNIESAAMMRVLSLPPDFFRSYNSGELSSRMGSINSLCSAIVSAVLSSGLTSVVSLLYITQIFSYTPMLVIPSLVIIILTVGLSLITMLMEIRRQKRIMEADAKTLGLSFALVNGIQKIRLSGAEKRSFSRWARFYNKSAHLQYNPPMILKVNGVLSEGIRLIGMIVLYAIAIAASVKVEDYMAFNVAYGMVMGAFTSLAGVVMVFARIKPVLDMASPILKTAPESKENGTVVTSLRGNIELDNVTFSYQGKGKKVIDNLSLSVKGMIYGPIPDLHLDITDL